LAAEHFFGIYYLQSISNQSVFAFLKKK